MPFSLLDIQTETQIIEDGHDVFHIFQGFGTNQDNTHRRGILSMFFSMPFNYHAVVHFIEVLFKLAQNQVLPNWRNSRPIAVPPMQRRLRPNTYDFKRNILCFRMRLTTFNIKNAVNLQGIDSLCLSKPITHFSKSQSI